MIVVAYATNCTWKVIARIATLWFVCFFFESLNVVAMPVVTYVQAFPTHIT